MHSAPTLSHLAAPDIDTPMPTRNDIAFIRSLRDRNTRHTERKFVVEGQKCVVQLTLDSGWAVHGLYRTEASGFEGHKAEVVSAKDMGRMSTFKTAPGILWPLGMPDVEPPSLKIGPHNQAVFRSGWRWTGCRTPTTSAR